MSSESHQQDGRVRRARPGDAAEMAETYVASWRDAYADVVPTRYLVSMSADKEASALRRKLATNRGSSTLLAAEAADGRIVGLAEFGAARATVAGLAGEVFVLYVHPDAMGQGFGRALFDASVQGLVNRRIESLVAWVLAANPARWFYEAMDGTPVGRKIIPFAGTGLPAVAYGWRDLRSVLNRTAEGQAE